MKSKIQTIILYILCGILCALPFTLNQLWFLSWIAYVPILVNEYVRKEESTNPYKEAWKRGFAFFFPFGVTTFYWIVELYPMDFVGFTPLTAFFVVSIAIIGVPAFQALFTSFNVVFLCFLKKCRVRQWLYPVAAACMWVIQEWLQTLTWAGIPWGKLANGQVGVLQNIQSASLLGPYLISFIIILFAGYLAIFLINIKNKEAKLRKIISLFVAVSIFIINFVYGQIALNTEHDYIGELKVAAIQGNIETEEKWSENAQEAMDIHRNLIIEASRYADLIVLAESAFPFNIENEFVKKYIENTATEIQTDLIVGCFTSDDKNVYNSTVYVTPEDGITDQIYHKQKLVPFGEFVPMRKVILSVLPFLGDINRLSSDITPGDNSALIQSEYGTIGSLICFDSIYETIALKSVQDGAQLLTISTNDSWFHDSSAANQHNAMAVLRAVENGRYVVRSGNTGISSIITDNGQTLQQLDVLKSGYVADTVKLSNHKTLYAQVGDIIILLSAVFIVLLVIRLSTKSRKIKKLQENKKNIEHINKNKNKKK